MKRIIVLLCLVLTSSCGYLGFNAGNHKVFEGRNDWVEDFNSYPVYFYDNKERLIKTDYITEISPKAGSVQTAYVGYSIASDKTYRKDLFEENYVKPNKSGVLNSVSVPHVLKANKVDQIIGEANVDGTKFALVPTSMKGFVMLISSDGTIYHKMGQVKRDRLVLLNPDYIPYPADLKYEYVKTTKMNQTRPTKGFDIKYDGTKLGRMFFIYYDYSSSDAIRGEFETLNFPQKEGNIKIYGVGIKILFADEQKVDYIILNY